MRGWWLSLLLSLPLIGMAATRWVIEAEGAGAMPGRTVVQDAKASGGLAVRSEGTSLACSGEVWLPPGEYVAAFRLKVSPAKGGVVGAVEIAGQTRAVAGSDFAAADVYQEVTLAFTLRLADRVRPTIRLTPGEGTTLWADAVRISATKRYSDDEQLALLAFARKPQLRLPGDAAGICLAQGLYHDAWRVAEVAPFLGGIFTTHAVSVTGEGATLRGFPATYEALYRYRVVVLASVPAAALSVEQRAMLEDFVKAGGGLVVLGGPYSYGRGGYRDSTILTRLLPVALGEEGDLVPCNPPAPLAPGATDLAAGILGADAPVVCYRHALTPKPKTEVLLRAGNEPLIVGGRYGQGRVAAVLATPLGDPDTHTPWWAWDHWSLVMARLLTWAAG